jgi:hypothetical protein
VVAAVKLFLKMVFLGKNKKPANSPVSCLYARLRGGGAALFFLGLRRKVSISRKDNGAVVNVGLKIKIKVPRV